MKFSGSEVVEFVSSSFGGVVEGNDAELARRFGDRLSVKMGLPGFIRPTDVRYTAEEVVDLVWDVFRPELKANGVTYAEVEVALPAFVEHMSEFGVGQP